MRFLRSAEDLLTAAERGLLVLLVVFMVALSFLQVVLRVGFSTGLLWGDTLGRHLVLWVGFLGAGIAAARDKQFAMDLTARLLRGRAKPAAQCVCHLFAFGVCCLLLKASAGFFGEEYAQKTALFTIGRVNVPAWLFELILPGGFGLLLGHYLIKAAQAAQGIVAER